MRRFTKHLSQSMLLIGMLFAGFIGMILFSYDKNIQFLIAILLSGGYVLWGVYHHKHTKSFHFEILLEYVAVALFGLTIIFTLIIRSWYNLCTWRKLQKR